MHKNWMELITYSTGVAQQVGGPVSSSGGASAERCDHAPFTVTKLLDKGSPKLSELCSTGKHISEVEISICRAGGEKLEYMNYKLSHAMVSSYNTMASSGEALPLDEISFTYGKIEYTYTQQKRADGSGGGVVATCYDLMKNAPC